MRKSCISLLRASSGGPERVRGSGETATAAGAAKPVAVQTAGRSAPVRHPWGRRSRPSTVAGADIVGERALARPVSPTGAVNGGFVVRLLGHAHNREHQHGGGRKRGDGNASPQKRLNHHDAPVAPHPFPPALLPITTTVWPRSSGLRGAVAVVAAVIRPKPREFPVISHVVGIVRDPWWR
jgi:hypothetical protein